MTEKRFYKKNKVEIQKVERKGAMLYVVQYAHNVNVLICGSTQGCGTTMRDGLTKKSDEDGAEKVLPSAATLLPLLGLILCAAKRGSTFVAMTCASHTVPLPPIWHSVVCKVKDYPSFRQVFFYNA